MASPVSTMVEPLLLTHALAGAQKTESSKLHYYYYYYHYHYYYLFIYLLIYFAGRGDFFLWQPLTAKGLTVPVTEVFLASTFTVDSCKWNFSVCC